MQTLQTWGKEKHNKLQYASAVILAFHQGIVMLIEKNKQEGAGRVGLDYTSSMATLCCVYDTSGKNCIVLAFV